MSYAAILDLLQRISAQDAAEAAAPDNVAVSGDLLTAIAAGGDISRWDADTVTDGNAAIQRVEQHLADATAAINGYLQTRYPQLIAAPDPRNADLLKRLCLDIAAWDLLGGDTDSDRRHKHKSAMKMLHDIAGGVVALALPTRDDHAASGATYSGDDPMFKRGDLVGF